MQWYEVVCTKQMRHLSPKAVRHQSHKQYDDNPDTGHVVLLVKAD